MTGVGVVREQEVPAMNGHISKVKPDLQHLGLAPSAMPARFGSWDLLDDFSLMPPDRIRDGKSCFLC